MRTLYDVLGVGQKAPFQEIRDAYHCRLNFFCPAFLDNLDESEKEAVTRELRWIRRAWGVLGSPEARSRYDQQLLRLILWAANSQRRVMPPALLTRAGAPPRFSCRLCGCESDRAATAVCPACGAPAKAVWIPRSRIIRRLGFAPVMMRIANSCAHQYRMLTGTLASVRMLIVSMANPAFIIVVVVVLFFLVAWLLQPGQSEQPSVPGNVVN
jgi:hypothetical protein